MNAEKFFTDMFYNIWQGHDIKRIDEFYAHNFKETISLSDDDKEPIEIHMNFADLKQQAILHQQNYRDTTLMVKKIFAADRHISVYFYSSSIEKKTGTLHHRNVCGIWHLNAENKIDRVWAVVTPHYGL